MRLSSFSFCAQRPPRKKQQQQTRISRWERKAAEHVAALLEVASPEPDALPALERSLAEAATV